MYLFIGLPVLYPMGIIHILVSRSTHKKTSDHKMNVVWHGQIVLVCVCTIYSGYCTKNSVHKHFFAITITF